ncbi:hypothetical protein ATE49_13690 [Elizabethkingia miricola]|uniref:phosphoglycolate phosphatase n=1 Tax=Elizabethkingia miricola TaxID=172045 RepID=A0ABY3NDY7_ELIMR|nr:HAD hydrolase-like protein [Elizabethkingia miricola]OBS13116.1 hypothetical protein ATE49_13690 [Elizabethkingia miricola]TYO89787.1 phosphoglycolate phosphatase [Elizabethkingia miricola]
MGTFEKDKLNIFLDLDGTLIDSRYRMYKLFSDLVLKCNLTFEEYWNKKFDGKAHKNILNEDFHYTDSEFQVFETNWMNSIEKNKYLELDTVINGVPDWLERISEKANLYIVTARQNSVYTELQLERLGLLKFFTKVFVTEQLKTKTQLILESGIPLKAVDLFVGDTGHDIKTGKELEIYTVAVLTGFMNKESLSKYNPDLLLNSIVDLNIKKYD